MSSRERKTCAKCGRSKIVDEFFSYRDGEKCEMCKQCLCEHIDNSDPKTFKWILEKFDVPYIERSWVETANKAYKEAPSKFGPMSVIGKYMRNMKMSQYKDYRFADSDSLNSLQPSESDEESEKELQRRLDAGEITQAQYDTLSGKVKSTSKDVAPIFTETDDMERDVSASLTDEDRRYLINKWGTSYTASEWLKMEDMYSRYAAEYDLNVDRAETLKKMCKTSLKMDIALDSDNMLDYKSLSQVLDSLRKSGKFTEVQNKEDRTGCVDSIGQLVMLCERDGGIIEQMPDPDEYPQDKIDLTIADIKRYSVSLLRNEPNISGLIESYVHKLEEADARTKALMGGKGVQLPPEPEEDLPPDIFSDMYEENLHPDEPDVPLDDEEADAIKARMGLV